MLDSSFADGPELVRITKLTNEETAFFGPETAAENAPGARNWTQSDTLKKGQAQATCRYAPYSSGAIAGYLDGNLQLLRVEAAAEYRALERLQRGMSFRYRCGRALRHSIRFVGAMLILYHVARWAFGS
jgi:hypothetical protein